MNRKFVLAAFVLLFGLLFMIVAKGTILIPGDQDNDLDVDLDDIQILLDHRGEVALPGDPKDLDNDGFVTVNDVRKTILLCTRENCATSETI